MADDVVPEPPGLSLPCLKMEESELTRTQFLDLPPEVIRSVLVLPNLSMRDVLRVAQTCHKMNALVFDDCNDVWRTIHRRRWPDANKLLLAVSQNINWQAECKKAVHVAQLTVSIMKDVWPKMYVECEVCYSHFAPIRKIMEEDKTAYFYIKDFLMDVINDGNIGANLTQKYQAKRVLQYVRQEFLTEQWKKFIALPEEEKLLEVGVSYVSQWCQPWTDIPAEHLRKNFDTLAGLVLKHLEISNPNHPILKIPADELRRWGEESLGSDKWSALQCMEVLRAIDYVLIKNLNFHGTKENYHLRENYLIDAVLVKRRGVPITLNIIVECIARRLGVRTEPWYRGHFVLMWKSDKNPDYPLVYLDAFNSGSLIRPETYMGNSGVGGCPYRDVNLPKNRVTCMEIIERLTAGIEVAGRMSMRNDGHSTYLRSALELMFIINPKNLTYILHLARLYMLYNISVSGLIDSVMSTIEELPTDVRRHAENILQMFKVYSPDSQNKPLPVPQNRKKVPNVQFAVGMSMYHKTFRYLCVIAGWDAKCAATDAWKQEMGIQWLKHKENQPFYNVLVPDGTTRYAAEENLIPLKASDSLNTLNGHPDVGRYFESYIDGYYIPNSWKQAEYPDDLDVCKHFYRSGME